MAYCPTVSRSFSIEYILSAGHPYAPAQLFPAGLLDALAGYQCLVKTAGIKSEDILIFGDSAGGHLALILVS